MDHATISEHEALYREHLRLGSYAPNTIRIALSDVKYFFKWLNAHYPEQALAGNHIDMVFSKFSVYVRSDQANQQNQKRRETSVLNYLNWLRDIFVADAHQSYSGIQVSPTDQTASNNLPDTEVSPQNTGRKRIRILSTVMFVLFVLVFFVYLFLKSAADSEHFGGNFGKDYFVINFNSQIVRSYLTDASSHSLTLKLSANPLFEEIKAVCTFKFGLEDLLYSTLSIPTSSCSTKIDNFDGFMRIEIDAVLIKDFEIGRLAAVSISKDYLDYHKAVHLPIFGNSNDVGRLLELPIFDEIQSNLPPSPTFSPDF